jgi:ethanolamine utilization protein EutN
MFLGRVVGCVWSTVKNPGLTGQRLLVIQPLTPELNPTGKRIIGTDCTGAGAGEIIYWCRGFESGIPFLPAVVPTDCTIVGIVDSLDINRQAKTEGGPEAAAGAASERPAPARPEGRRKKGGGC